MITFHKVFIQKLQKKKNKKGICSYFVFGITHAGIIILRNRSSKGSNFQMLNLILSYEILRKYVFITVIHPVLPLML